MQTDLLSHLVTALADAGHEIICAVKNIPPHEGIAEVYLYPVDYTRDFEAEVWRTRISDIDVVINAVGIIREKGQQTFESLHERAPKALFSASAAAGIRVVQISALGADEAASSQYHLSKRLLMIT